VISEYIHKPTRSTCRYRYHFSCNNAKRANPVNGIYPFLLIKRINYLDPLTLTPRFPPEVFHGQGIRVIPFRLRLPIPWGWLCGTTSCGETESVLSRCSRTELLPLRSLSLERTLPPTFSHCFPLSLVFSAIFLMVVSSFSLSCLLKKPWTKGHRASL
jgi:hypothetical protein